MIGWLRRRREARAALEAEAAAREALIADRFDALWQILLPGLCTELRPFICHKHLGIDGLRLVVTDLTGHWIAEAVDQHGVRHVVRREPAP